MLWPSCADTGLSCTVLRHLGAIVGPSWAILGPPWAIFGPSGGYLGPSWAILGPSWGQVGPSWGHLGPSWAYLGPSWGQVGPFWVTSGDILEHLGPIWAHLEATFGLPSLDTRPKDFLHRPDVTYTAPSCSGVENVTKIVTEARDHVNYTIASTCLGGR